MLQHKSPTQPELPRHPLDDSIGLRHGSFKFSEKDLVEFRELLKSELPAGTWTETDLPEMANNVFIAIATLASCARGLEQRRRTQASRSNLCNSQ
jgi:hypothetical protein